MGTFFIGSVKSNTKESFIDSAKHVLRVASKPTEREVMRNLKIILTGILILGAIGLIISVIFWFIYP
ncbi:MAG: protein translocase SEC61 complex subunit gamma [Candidatus Micrarchaeia archaeon]